MQWVLLVLAFVSSGCSGTPSKSVSVALLVLMAVSLLVLMVFLKRTHDADYDGEGHPSTEQLERYLSHTCSRLEHEAVGLHLAECVECHDRTKRDPIVTRALSDEQDRAVFTVARSVREGRLQIKVIQKAKTPKELIRDMQDRDPH